MKEMMAANEFLKDLEELLQDVSVEERESALLYYENYFQDAGPERAEEVIRELGSPGKVANIIIEELKDGESYNTSYYNDDYSSGAPIDIEVQDKESKTDAGNTKNNIALLILLILLAIPIGLPILLAICGVLIGIVSGLFGIFIAILISAIAFLLSGVVMILLGITNLFIMPPNGAIMSGGGLLLLGLGSLGMILSILIVSKMIPAIFVGTINLFNKLFNKRGERRDESF